MNEEKMGRLGVAGSNLVNNGGTARCIKAM